MHDVFISYEHQSKSIADNICSVLERNKIRCWYAPRDVIGDYATSIVEAISNTKIFILILNEDSSNSMHVLNEVEMAYKRGSNVTILPFKIDNKTLSMAMEYYVKRLHWIDASDKSLDIAINELMLKIASLLGINLKNEKKEPVKQKTSARVENKYFSNTDNMEVQRLKTQSSLMKKFDQPVYDSLINGKDNLTILDIGSNNGDFIMDRLGLKENVSLVIGLEYDMNAVEDANNKYNSHNGFFYKQDLEAIDLDANLQKILAEHGLKSFDVLNVSMTLLHLKTPYKVLKTIRKYLSTNGKIIVKDIDDGINFAYPDPNERFSRVYRICKENDTSGFRHSGRQVYSLLSKIGMKHIKLEKSGLDSSEMDFSEKQALFDTYFTFIKEDLEIMVERYPDSERVKEDYEWFMENYDEMEEHFHSSDFIFSLGFMIYTAE